MSSSLLLKVSMIHVHDMAALEAGTEASLFTGNVAIRLVVTPVAPIEHIADNHGYMVIVAEHGSHVDLHRVKRDHTWTRLAKTAHKDTSVLVVDGPAD